MQHLPVDRYYDPAEYAEFVDYGRTIGLRHVEAGPLVRSSYHAEKIVLRGAASDLSAAPIALMEAVDRA
jgi:lipoic acid synthetase